MRKKILSLLGVFLLFASLSTAIASETCPIGVDSFGAQYMICVPTPWNGDLVVFAHGYVSPLEPVAIPLNQLSLPDGTSIPGLVTSLGYAFATTSYRENGLAVIPGIDDLVNLVTLFRTEFPATHHVYLVGASEGGLITTLALWRFRPVAPESVLRKTRHWGSFLNVLISARRRCWGTVPVCQA